MNEHLLNKRSAPNQTKWLPLDPSPIVLTPDGTIGVPLVRCRKSSILSTVLILLATRAEELIPGFEDNVPSR
jgi:hypothetical protein